MSFSSGAFRRLACVAALGVLGATGFTQRAGGQEGASPPASFTATSIPGVVAAGTKIELVKAGLGRTEGPVARDGAFLF